MSVKLIPEIDEVLDNLGIPGIAAIVLLPVIVPVAGKVVKPIAKAAIKGGIVLYEQGKGVIAEVGETLEDLIAEAKAELAEAEVKEAEAIEGAIDTEASAA
jgi:Protein of unknown function (DUF5132)